MRYEVTAQDTAAALGSGEVEVLATPRLLAWMEAETVRAVAPLLEAGQTSVGTAVRIEHVRASPVGASVEVSAQTSSPAGSRRLTFAVIATGDDGERVAAGEIDRVVVDTERFVASVTGHR